MITLTSDFGTPYPASMKGVILQHSDARLVDVGHDFPRQDVRSTAFWLTQTLPEFPPAVHLVVVDPGVGTDRAALVVRAGDHVLVGPDNGVLLPPARALASGSDEAEYATDIDAYEIAVEDPRSSTFHGRDVFAPAAATVHEAGIDRLPELELVSPAGDVVDLEFPEPQVRDDGATGEVLAVDAFGNAVTNVPGDVLTGRERIHVDREPTPVVRSYARVDVGTAVATVGSHGNVELAVNQGRGDEAFGLSTGDRVDLTFDPGGVIEVDGASEPTQDAGTGDTGGDDADPEDAVPAHADSDDADRDDTDSDDGSDHPETDGPSDDEDSEDTDGASDDVSDYPDTDGASDDEDSEDTDSDQESGFEFDR